MRMMLNRRNNGEDGKTENTQGRPDSSYSLQELLIFPQPMLCLNVMQHLLLISGGASSEKWEKVGGGHFDVIFQSKDIPN